MIADINRLSNKQAKTIAAAELEDNPYLRDIQNAARWLVAQGRGDSFYLTHYASGSTVWRHPTLDSEIVPRQQPQTSEVLNEH